MRCTCHELSLTMRCAIKSSEDTLYLLKKVQQIVVHINGSSSRVSQFQAFQQQKENRLVLFLQKKTVSSKI